MADDVPAARFSDVRADIMVARDADREGRSASLLMREWIAGRRDGDGEQAPKWLGERLAQLDEQDARRRRELTDEAIERQLEERDRRLVDHDRRLDVVEMVVVALRAAIAGLQVSMVALRVPITGLQKSMVEVKAAVAGVLVKLHNNRGAGAKPKKRDEIMEHLRAEIEAGRATLDEYSGKPSKWAKIHNYHHETFAAAIAVLMKEGELY